MVVSFQPSGLGVGRLLPECEAPACLLTAGLALQGSMERGAELGRHLTEYAMEGRVCRRYWATQLVVATCTK